MFIFHEHVIFVISARFVIKHLATLNLRFWILEHSHRTEFEIHLELNTFQIIFSRSDFCGNYEPIIW